MNPSKFLIYQLYLLQIENYELGRFWRLLFKKGYFGSSQPLRKNIVWTPKVTLVLILSMLIIIALLCILNPFLSSLYLLSIAIIAILLMPIFYSVSTIILSPIDRFAKNMAITKAKQLVLKNKDLKIIGIAGSYGKTTMKSVLTSVLLNKFKVLSAPESINTPVGIAQWITKDLKPDTQILIVEMGEHYKGDVRDLCQIAKPDIAIITGINEAHVERLGYLEETTSTIFELVENSKHNALILLNSDDKRVNESYEKYIQNQSIEKYTSNVSGARFDPEQLNWIFDFDGAQIEVPILGEYIIGVVGASIIIAKKIGMTNDEIKNGIKSIRPVKNRLEPIRSASGVLVIDDSYNGNPDGVREAINVLAKFPSRRRLFITPGIVETGKENEKVHQTIGRQLAKIADKVILIKNSATPWIEKGLTDAGFDSGNIIWFETAQKAHESLSKILKPNDVILFQNDWGDQYL